MNFSTFVQLLMILAALPAATAEAKPFEVATLLGSPNMDLPWVQSAVKNQVLLTPGQTWMDITTGVVYFASRNGAESVQTIQVVREEGNARLADVFSAIDIAARDSAIVVAPLAGDKQEEMCEKMAEKTDTAFLIALGERGYTLSPLFTKCASRNILFVTVLNPEGTGLAEFATYGPLVRLAAPGRELEAPVDRDGRKVSYLSDIFGMSVAAGQLSALARKSPDLSGAALIQAFLQEQPVLETLRGKIPGARAILKYEK